jgi:hypothetical protein
MFPIQNSNDSEPPFHQNKEEEKKKDDQEIAYTSIKSKRRSLPFSFGGNLGGTSASN